MSALTIIAIGFVLGMRHATDPDHVIAVTTIVARGCGVRRAAMTGIVWGIGHTLTIFIVGIGIILLNWKIPVKLGLSMELAVGIMLVILGTLNLTGVFNRLFAVTEVYDIQTDSWSEQPSQWMVGHWRPLLVGIVHGLSGSAAVALLVLATIHQPTWALAYMLLFGLGTVAGMMLITAGISLPFAFVKGENIPYYFRIASGVLSVCFGLFICYQMGIVNGLFTHHPNWTPS